MVKARSSLLCFNILVQHSLCGRVVIPLSLKWWNTLVGVLYPRNKDSVGSIRSPSNTPSTHLVVFLFPLSFWSSLFSSQTARQQHRHTPPGEVSSLVFSLPPTWISLPLYLTPNRPVPVLYVSRLGQVRYEGHNHPHIHPCSNGDGKSRQEEGSPGAHSCSGEVSLRDGLACLTKQSRE